MLRGFKISIGHETFFAKGPIAAEVITFLAGLKELNVIFRSGGLEHHIGKDASFSLETIDATYPPLVRSEKKESIEDLYKRTLDEAKKSNPPEQKLPSEVAKKMADGQDDSDNFIGSL